MEVVATQASWHGSRRQRACHCNYPMLPCALGVVPRLPHTIRSCLQFRVMTCVWTCRAPPAIQSDALVLCLMILKNLLSRTAVQSTPRRQSSVRVSILSHLATISEIVLVNTTVSVPYVWLTSLRHGNHAFHLAMRAPHPRPSYYLGIESIERSFVLLRSAFSQRPEAQRLDTCPILL